MRCRDVGVSPPSNKLTQIPFKSRGYPSRRSASVLMEQADGPSRSEMPCQVPRKKLAGSPMTFPGSYISLMKAGLLMERRDVSVRRAMFQPEIVPGVRKRSLM